MHYKDGKEAKIGDLVKGVPYNNGGRVIVGELIRATPDSQSCNCIVAFAKSQLLPAAPEEVKRSEIIFNRQPGGIVDNAAPCNEVLSLTIATDYGQLDAFELVYRAE